MATILIVDDNPANRRLLVALLEHRGHRMLEAQDGGEALLVARNNRPDLVVADLLMPIMDGHELLRQMRGDPNTGRIPVVFFTAHYGARALALKGGAAWFLNNGEAAQLPGIVERVLAGEREDPNVAGSEDRRLEARGQESQKAW